MYLAAVVVVGLVVGALLGVAGACSCGDRDGCGSSLSCTGKSPDDDCSPPKGGTCKVINGFSGVFTCCCSCRKGNTSAAACSGFTEVKASLASFTQTATPCGKLAKATARATVSAAGTTLGQAQKACRKDQAAKEDAKVAATTKTFTKFEQKIQKLLAKNKITNECKQNLIALADDLVIETRNAGETTVEPPTTTTTTTLPNPPNLSCSGLFTPYDAAECDYLFSCTGSGPSPFNGFGLVVNGRQITNKIDPTGFTCSFGSAVTPNDSVICQGTVPFGVDVSGGRLHFVPNWANGMGAALQLYTNGSVAATYNITGP